MPNQHNFNKTSDLNEHLVIPSKLSSYIKELTTQKIPPKELIDIFIKNLKNSMNNSSVNISDYFFIFAFKQVLNWVESKYTLRKEIKENLDYFGELLKPELIKSSCGSLRTEVFKNYLEKPKMGSSWDFFSELPNIEQQNIFWNIISEKQITQKVIFRKLNIKNYQNSNRKLKGNDLNLKEKALKDFLYAHYQIRKGRTDFFKYVCDTLPNLEINHEILNKRLHPVMIFPQNFYMLEEPIRQKLNQNFYDCKINKTIYSLNTEDSILFYRMTEGGEKLLKEGYFIKIDGSKSYDKEDYIKYFSNIVCLKNIIPMFLLNKADKAKSSKNKSFWRYLHINLKIENSPKEHTKKSLKI